MAYQEVVGSRLVPEKHSNMTVPHHGKSDSQALTGMQDYLVLVLCCLLGGQPFT